MAVASQTVALRPSGEIRQAQDVVRSILLKDDLLEDEMLAEFVRAQLTNIEEQLGRLWGRQMMFEAMIKS